MTHSVLCYFNVTNITAVVSLV